MTQIRLYLARGGSFTSIYSMAYVVAILTRRECESFEMADMKLKLTLLVMLVFLMRIF